MMLDKKDNKKSLVEGYLETIQNVNDNQILINDNSSDTVNASVRDSGDWQRDSVIYKSTSTGSLRLFCLINIFPCSM